jgi:hypothetical protein
MVFLPLVTCRVKRRLQRCAQSSNVLISNFLHHLFHFIRPLMRKFVNIEAISYRDGIISLYETVHKLHSKKLNGVILKLDCEKSYDKVKWSFLQQTLGMKGFLMSGVL